ncbi:hypothetical protein GCM10023258_13500 [Terrabacter aeriphilus]|uniref:AlgX/AlgJ SGNH hydrolase-like domain-containing protein n=2 Tax=Terrabacter aeriphilus TaxID=515662 RepID=A0ABP9J941_9MICO
MTSLHTHTTPLTEAPLRVFLSGSCVSRDTFEFLHPESFELVDYVARQSLISAFSPPAPVPAETEAMPSPFQRRMSASDAASELPATVEAVATGTDVVLWDLVDERLGVWEHRGGGWSTDSVELRAARAMIGAPASDAVHHAFGSAVHRREFDAALLRWRDLLIESGLRDRTLLVVPPWAERTTTGEATPPSFDLGAGQANALLTDYIGRAREVVGVPVVGADDPLVLADPDHKWGLAPFHYDDQSYLRLALAIAARCARPRTGHQGIPVDQRPPSVRATSMRRQDAPPSVTLFSVAPNTVTATVHRSTGRAFAFHLFSGRAILARQHYGPSREHSFDVTGLGRGPFHVKAFVLDDERQRTSVVSPRVRLG